MQNDDEAAYGRVQQSSCVLMDGKRSLEKGT